MVLFLSPSFSELSMEEAKVANSQRRDTLTAQERGLSSVKEKKQSKRTERELKR